MPASEVTCTEKFEPEATCEWMVKFMVTPPAAETQDAAEIISAGTLLANGRTSAGHDPEKCPKLIVMLSPGARRMRGVIFAKNPVALPTTGFENEITATI
jgi:hypothetical protein